MKIATYNIWNSDAGMPARFGQLADVIAGLGADIICLQEVASLKKHNELSELCKYGYSHWQEQTELSVLSRYPINEVFDYKYGTAVLIQCENKTLLLINVHLPWDKASERERGIVDIIQNTAGVKADCTIIAGDYNCSDNSSVHRFMTGEQSLLGCDAYFFDLAEAFSDISGTKATATLNFRENPRWGIAQAKNTIEINQRFDRILLKNTYPAELPMLKNCKLFGTKISEETHLSASDHYGVAVEIEL
ncbi:MAG: endonuclease/exonuclease/phosphatase family protein [Eubacterium sp.]|nr:endonuclease/exonuclease/phosphatase family protein [Eubacterium sp.]